MLGFSLIILSKPLPAALIRERNASVCRDGPYMHAVYHVLGIFNTHLAAGDLQETTLGDRSAVS